MSNALWTKVDSIHFCMIASLYQQSLKMQKCGMTYYYIVSYTPLLFLTKFTILRNFASLDNKKRPTPQRGVGLPVI